MGTAHELSSLTWDAFVGRTDELALLAEALESTLQGSGSLVVLSGEPGIGKTRLAQEFARTAAARGVQVLWGRCEADLTYPYRPFLELARQGLAAKPPKALGQALERLLRGLGGSASGSGPAAPGGIPHTVEPGESLWSIAAANGIPEAALAQANGLSPEALLYAGQTIRVPAAGGAPDAAAGIPLGAIWSPWGTMYLRSDAAAAWNELRQASLEQYGVDLYPEGPLGAYRTYDQQAQLYSAFLDGAGPPADPPGQSEHNLGIALDLATPAMRSIVDAIGAAYGWVKVSAPGEWWHVTYVG